MDYCSSCRRNLNGALMCPGCGAYAPDIAPPAPRQPDAAAAAATPWDTPWDPWGTAEMPASPDAVADAPVEDHLPVEAPSVGAGSAAPTGQGRAARRRQLARWKKHKRRAVAATAFAIAGGALTVALLPNKPSTSQTHAAAAPDPEAAGAPRTENTAASSEQPDSRASRHTNSRPPVKADRQQNTGVAAPRTATPSQRPTVAAHPAATASATPYAAPVSGKGTQADDGGAAAPETTAAAPREDSGDGGSTSQTSPAPSTPESEPTSPTQVCLLGVVCVD
ncbi:hypothetical protein FCH28_34950 [Streptomyces piniterrae]|uniref:Uncharacterized protein n=1 Tax=Streptomyces piniterrae TaxID=2571125 RepID=A0A4U0MNF0_9ACTN|nr:hypothetical protein [Streptomyces piniterrae]TJZ42219.1 hypothetical protein FCH28_34950 [Streptomyces piniterrae]